MAAFITSTVMTLETMFSGRYMLDLPWFQRGYAWSDKHSGRLLKDLLEAKASPQHRYALGHVFLAKPGPGPKASIIDGHQRALTITILFALLRDLLGDVPVATRLHNLIVTANGQSPILTSQPGVMDFLQALVQQRGTTLREPDGDIMDLSENERNILWNRNHLRGMLLSQVRTARQYEALAVFLMEHCLVIVDEVADEEEAWTLLTTEEETGLGFHSSERAKVSIISAMPRAEQEEAGRIYERAQAMLGADDMAKLLAHLRALKVRKRTSKPIEKELIHHFDLKRYGLDFMRQHLLPRATTMAQIKNREIGDGPAGEATALAIKTLLWVDHQMWMPAALHWMAERGGGHEETPLFFQRLERLVYLLKIAGTDPTDQESRLLELLGEINAGLPVADMPVLQIEPALLADALDNLNSRTFYAKRCHALVLRRISWNLDQDRDQGPVDGKKVTVEHILPRKPAKHQQWSQDFPTPQDIAEHVNRLGNLAFLAIEENNVAATSDWVVKRLILANASDRFILSEHASSLTTWTRETILLRTEALISVLLTPWKL